MEFNNDLQEYFGELNVEIILFPEKKATRKFRSLNSFYNYILKERDFWEDNTRGKAGKIRKHFYDIVNQIESAGKQNDINQSRKNLNQAIKDANINDFPCVYSKSPISEFIKKRYEVDYSQCDAAIDYYFNNTIQNSTNKEYFKGLIYSFTFKDKEVAATQEIGSERRALVSLREEFTHDLNEIHNDYLDKKNALEEMFAQYQKEIGSWKDNLQSQTQDFLDEKQTTVKNLESLYNEKLRLERPASYWKELSDKYEEKGKNWRTWALVTSVVTILFLSLLLYYLPDYLYLDNNQFNFNSLKGTIIFGLIASVCIYVIRLFVKLSTSAFHLSRDAYERFQLTHIYLSLLNEKGVEETERSIILQSLFSRADTGLLKGDSSPKLPDGILSQIFKNFGH